MAAPDYSIWNADLSEVCPVDKVNGLEWEIKDETTHDNKWMKAMSAVTIEAVKGPVELTHEDWPDAPDVTIVLADKETIKRGWRAAPITVPIDATLKFTSKIGSGSSTEDAEVAISVEGTIEDIN